MNVTPLSIGINKLLDELEEDIASHTGPPALLNLKRAMRDRISQALDDAVLQEEAVKTAPRPPEPAYLQIPLREQRDELAFMMALTEVQNAFRANLSDDERLRAVNWLCDKNRTEYRNHVAV